MLKFCKPLFLLLFIVFINHLTFPQTLPELEKVKEIKLLEHSREDVLKILGEYELDAREKYHSDWFSTKDADIRVDYSEGNCGEFSDEGFKVPEWKVSHIVVEFNEPIKPKNININLLKYKKERKYSDIKDIYAYYDKELGIILEVQEGLIGTINFIPSSKYYGLMCDEEKAKKLSSTSSIFVERLKDRKGIISCPVANVNRLNLSQTKIKGSCNLTESKTNRNCSSKSKIIEISTIATDPEDDALVYSYTVSVGKIIGNGAKVLWDLSDVKPGTYTITAAVDDGCGFCGKTMTKTVTVKTCPDCKKP